ncbi:hypothetical protein OPV22_006608 [Ensete ventricosum]|uniref:Uncharacterized protein n=1 Tax=Ensete ventricosum TaxID=4639 RepID=A0AAV8Q4N9_ENSVE|nr:hypothetical protein OPV22_006608 [Ensete ventricosum]
MDAVVVVSIKPLLGRSTIYWVGLPLIEPVFHNWTNRSIEPAFHLLGRFGIAGSATSRVLFPPKLSRLATLSSHGVSLSLDLETRSLLPQARGQETRAYFSRPECFLSSLSSVTKCLSGIGVASDPPAAPQRGVFGSVDLEAWDREFLVEVLVPGAGSFGASIKDLAALELSL